MCFSFVQGSIIGGGKGLRKCIKISVKKAICLIHSLLVISEQSDYLGEGYGIKQNIYKDIKSLAELIDVNDTHTFKKENEADGNLFCLSTISKPNPKPEMHL